MKNNFLIIIVLYFFSSLAFAENVDISAKNISIDKKKEITIFKDKVIIRDENNNIVESNYAEYNKKSNFFILRNDIVITDYLGNIFKGDNATYDGNLKLINIKGDGTLLTSESYKINSSDIIINFKKNSVLSKKKTIIEDIQNNLIYLSNFEYQKNKNIFKSIGKIKVTDSKKNSFEFSQIYIDEKKREIIGSDSRLFFNQKEFRENKKNNPRIFSNVVNIKNEKSEFIKSTFTMCGYRKSDKCPPWELNASKMTHDKKKKTIFYDNALIKIYNIPIFYLPKLAHPDPTVDRRSGFLNPSYSDTKNLGSSINLPYFWAIGGDKDLTINNRLFATEHPLFIGQYRQKFKNSSLSSEFGFTEGYKSNSKIKKSGNKDHFFSKFVKTFEMNNGTFNNLEINLQHVTNKKYLKLYKIESNLINYETETLENYINFDSINDEKSFLLSLNASNFRSIADEYNDKHEFILPEISINKFLFTEQLGYGNLNTNLKIHNYDTNKYKKFLINDFNWSYDRSFANLPYDGEFLTSFKNVNYEVKNVEGFKEDTTSEVFGALGYLASIDLLKKRDENVSHFLQPKILLRYSPNHMRNINESFNLNNKDIFTLNRVNSPPNFESGTNLTYGFDYKRNKKDNEMKFSLGQIINEKKNNKNISDTSSLDKRFSDIIGSFNYDDNKKFKINYDYSLDQNFKEMNYNEVNASYDFNNIKFNIDYLEQNNISNKVDDEKEYIKSSLEIKKGDNGLFTFSNKRNIITNSSEFYNMSYEYINDCLRAGLIFRREFYNDSELEAENSLMFKITLSPFGELSSPSFSQ